MGSLEELNLNKILADVCALIRFHLHSTDHNMYSVSTVLIMYDNVLES